MTKELQLTLEAAKSQQMGMLKTLRRMINIHVRNSQQLGIEESTAIYSRIMTTLIKAEGTLADIEELLEIL